MTERLSLIDTHLRETVRATALNSEPGPHMVIERVLPADVYGWLVDTMPPPEGFDYADKYKQNFDPALTTIAPERSRQAWQWFEREVVDGLLAPILVKRFRGFLDVLFDDLFGPLAAESRTLRQHAFRGRLMLRRPGYRLKPHRDTKIVTITGLIYFARPDDSRDYGTELYRVEADQQAPSMKTFYPEEHGCRAELARSVPFVGNTALIFLNTPGMAHAAAIPRDAAQAERYAYQFYIGPSEHDLAELVGRLPPARRDLWSGLTLGNH
jgi:hypothetical protein